MTISISWEWALGILITLIGSLITLAWKASARFTALETSVDWIKGILRDLKVNSDNDALGQPAFTAYSPVNLTPSGEKLLEESGLKAYIDAHPGQFQEVCDAKRNANPYEIQKHIFKLFEEVAFDPFFDDVLKKFVFEKGTTIDVLRRIGAIYFRNVCLERFGMKKEDIDKHDPGVHGIT